MKSKVITGLYIAKKDLIYLARKPLKSGRNHIDTIRAVIYIAAVLKGANTLTIHDIYRVWGRTAKSVYGGTRKTLKCFFHGANTIIIPNYTPTPREDLTKTGYIRIDSTITARVKWTPTDLTAFIYLLLQKQGAARSIDTAAETLCKRLQTDTTDKHRHNARMHNDIRRALIQINGGIKGETFVVFGVDNTTKKTVKG